MAEFRAVWSGYPATWAGGKPAVPLIPVSHALMPIPQPFPLLYLPPPKENRMVDLLRSVLNLVDAHDHLALTDPELLGWYLSLCLEDRKIIQDEGGLHQFLLSHPALNLCQDLIVVKNENSSRAVTSSLYRTPGRRGSCECLAGAPYVLAFRCTMCPQHSWRLSYTSADGSRISTTPQDPAAHILHTLQRLDSDYDHMKQQILAAVPLEQLQHLDVASTVSAAAHRVPVQGVGDGLPGSCRSPQNPQKLFLAAEYEEDCSSQVTERSVASSDPGRRAAAPQSCSRGSRLDQRQTDEDVWLSSSSSSSCLQRSVSQEALGPTEICEEVGEVWYDAEDELQLSGASAEEVADGAGTPPLQRGGRSGHADINSPDTESAGGESGSVPSVSNGEAGQVSVCSLGAASRGQHRPESCWLPGPLGSGVWKPHVGCRRTSEPPPLPSSSVVSLDGKQTFVSQTWGTMSSISTLTAELRPLHPHASRASIMAALTQLINTHKGALRSLPLESIRDMTSDLLSRQAKD